MIETRNNLARHVADLAAESAGHAARADALIAVVAATLVADGHAGPGRTLAMRVGEIAALREHERLATLRHDAAAAILSAIEPKQRK